MPLWLRHCGSFLWNKHLLLSNVDRYQRLHKAKTKSKHITLGTNKSELKDERIPINCYFAKVWQITAILSSDVCHEKKKIGLVLLPKIKVILKQFSKNV
jgi:hypothetical protein